VATSIPPVAAPPQRQWLNRRNFLLASVATITGVATARCLGADMDTQNRWYGLFVPGKNTADFDALAANFAVKPSVAGYFIRFNSAFTATTLSRFGDKNLTPFLTVEPWVLGMKAMDITPDYSLRALRDGSHDEDFRRIAKVIAEYDKPIFLRLAHEMNGWWYPWAVGQNGNTPQDYIDFWKHVRDIMSPIAPKIRWVWACAAVNGLRLGAPTVASLFPGDELVDYAGTTGYGWDLDAATTYGKTFTKLADVTAREFLIPEMGAQNGVNKAGTTGVAWTQSLRSYLAATPRVRGFVWFHIDPSIGATGDYRLSDPETIAALNDVLRDVPIRTNDSFSAGAGQPLVTIIPTPPSPDAGVDAVPATPLAVQGVIKGHACDPRGPRAGYDKYGNLYECYTTPEGWSRWRPVGAQTTTVTTTSK
jgi:hypothetical protein